MASVDDVFLSLDEVSLAHPSRPLSQPKIISREILGLFSVIGMHFGIVQSHYIGQDGALMALFKKNQCRPAALVVSIFDMFVKRHFA